MYKAKPGIGGTATVLRCGAVGQTAIDPKHMLCNGNVVAAIVRCTVSRRRCQCATHAVVLYIPAEAVFTVVLELHPRIRR